MSKAEKSTTTTGKKSFDDEIKSKDKAYVLFYATWCPYSQKFLPIFEEYERSNPKECIKIIVDDKPNLCEEYSIEYYPTVLYLEKGKVHKRIDAEPGLGLTKKQLKEFTKKP
jgi:thiol-disulfide isomerase/thioredoxin